MRHLSKRWLSLFLALVLTLGMVTLPASADDQEETADGSVISLVEEETAEAGDEAEETTAEETEAEEAAAEETTVEEDVAEETAAEETSGIEEIEVTGEADNAEAAEGTDTEEEEETLKGTETAAGSGYISTWYENGLAQGLYASPILKELAGIKFQNETIADILNMSQDPELEDFSFSTFFANTVFADLSYEDLLAYYEAGYEDMNEILADFLSSSSKRRASSSARFLSSYTLTGTRVTSAPSVYMSIYGTTHGQLWYLELGDYNAYCLDYGYNAASGTTYYLVDTSERLTEEEIYLVKTGIIYALLFRNGNGKYDITEDIPVSTSNATYYIITQLFIWGVMSGAEMDEIIDCICTAWTDSFNDEDVAELLYTKMTQWWEEGIQDNYDLDNFEIAVYHSGDSTDQYLLMYDFDTLEELPKTGQISLTKSGVYMSSANVSGAVYTVYSDSSCTDAVATLTTNSSGYGITDEFEVDEDNDYYYVKETTAPTGTILNDTVYKVSTSSLVGATVYLNDLYDDISNEEISGQFFVVKTDSGTGETLTGAVFAVYYGDNYSNFREYLTYNEETGRYESSVYHYTTNNNGKFRIVEVSAPDGYVNSGWYVDVELSEDTPTFTYYVENSASSGGVSIQKVDADTETAAAQGNATLAGAVYVIADAETGEEVTRITTDETGYAETGTDTLSFGDYILYEMEASTGYTVDDTQIAFTVDTTHTIVTLTDDTGEEATSKEAVIRGGVIIQKGDYQTGAAVLLAGAEFTIYNSSDAAVIVDGVSYEPGEAILVLTTNGAGLAYTDSDVLPYGSYTVVETKAPTGYTISGITTLNFDITEDGEMVDLTGTGGILDIIIRGDFEFSKIDFETQEEMAGVSFLITSDTTGESHVITTDENGYYSSSSDYVLHSCDTNEGTAGSGLWFGYDSEGNWAEVDDTLGALPYGTYTIVELAGDNNENKKLVSGTITITKDGYTVDLGTIQNKTISITTTAVAEETNSHYAYADDSVKIIDTVSYYNTYTDEEQVIIGVLMNAETGEAVTDENGNAITSEYSFTPTTESGNVEIQYTFDASDLAGADVVVYEYMYLVTDDGNELIASHADITDEGQTIHFPAITTEALDSVTGDQVSFADEELTITETVSYSNLEAGKKYTLTASLYNAETGEILVVNGEEVTQTTTFTPEDSDGTVEVDITFDASELAGNTIIIFEELSRDNTLYAAEEDLTEVDQTVYIPELETTAIDSESGIQNSLADGEITIIDTVAYDHVLPGVDYTVSGVLYDQSTGKPLLVNGEVVTASTTFTAESSSGTVEVIYTFDGTGLEDTTLVVFAALYYGTEDETAVGYLITYDTGTVYASVVYGENLVAVHKDIEDEAQTIYIPEIGTTAEDAVTEDHVALAGEITIEDTVEYSNLIVGKEYMVSGVLYNKDTGEPILVDGEEVTGSTTFTAETSSGSVVVYFTFDASALAGTTIVAFEYLDYEGVRVAIHAEIEDEQQTVYIPELETTALDSESGIQNSLADEEITIIDTVSYDHVLPGVEYTVIGVLYDQSTGEPLLVDGEEVTGSTTFTAESISGTVEVAYTFDGTGLEDTTLVVYETLYYGENPVAVHEDIEDEAQTIYIPEIGTTALDEATETHNALAEEEVTITDTVTYTNLLAGKEYTVSGILYDKSTGEPVLVNGEEVTASTTFTAESTAGTVQLTYTFDASSLAGTAIVVFEDLYYDGVKVAAHADLTDEDQTVTLTEVPSEDEDTTESEAVQTGDGIGLILWMVSAMAALAAAAVFTLVRGKKERDR